MTTRQDTPVQRPTTTATELADRGAPAPRRRSLVARRPQLIVTPVIALLALGAWVGAIKVFDIPKIVLPSPDAVVVKFWSMVTTSALWRNLGVTMFEFVMGFAIGALAAVVVGAVFARIPLLERGFSPYIIAFQNFPKIAIAPLFVTWFGFGLAPKIVLAMILAFFPVFVNVIAGLKSSSKEQVDLMRSLSASEWQMFTMLRLKVAMPYLFAGLRVAAVFGLLGAITGEFISSSKGLGYMLLQQNSRLAVDGVFALLIVMAAVGLAVHFLLGFLHKRLIFWDNAVNKQPDDLH
jgi:NitT/TauT family transport system permease protein